MRVVVFILLGALNAVAQPVLPAFDVADVKLHPPGAGGGQDSLRDGRARFTNITVRSLIAEAWSVPEDGVLGAASGIESRLSGVKLDIVARASGSSVSEAEMRLMLRALLTERMQLRVRMEKRSMPVYALRLGKGGPKLEASTAPGQRGEGECRETGGDEGRQILTCTHMTMEMLAAQLRELAPRDVDRRVVDESKIAGWWNFKIEWTAMRAADAGGLSIFAALQAQLGLRLEGAKAEMPVVIVDGMAAGPIPN